MSGWSAGWLLRSCRFGCRVGSGQRGAPAAQRGRTTLTASSDGRAWQAKKRPARTCGWLAEAGAPGELGRTCRALGGSAGTATLRYAGRNRRSVMRRRVPLTTSARARQGGHSEDGDRFCHGGGSTRPAQRHALVGPISHQAHRDHRRVSSGHVGGHLGPHEPGELAGDRGGHHRLGVLDRGQAPEPPTQAGLGLPRTSDGLRRHAVLAAAQRRSHRGAVLVGPRGLDQLGAHLFVAGLGQVPAAARPAAGT